MMPGGAPCGRVAASSAHRRSAATTPTAACTGLAVPTRELTPRARFNTLLWIERRLAGRVLADLIAPAAVDLHIRALLAIGGGDLAFVPIDLARVDDGRVGVAVIPGPISGG